MKAVFFDKDGTLIENVPYNIDPTLIRLSPGAGPALRSLSQAGYKLVVVSNQSGVARGYFPEDALIGVHGRLADLVNECAGATLGGFYYCPHHPNGKVPKYSIECDCRKPRPGLIFRAAKEMGIILQHSWFIGDILDDVEAGKRAGCSTILIDNGNETLWDLSPDRIPDYYARDLEEAACLICKSEVTENLFRKI